VPYRFSGRSPVANWTEIDLSFSHVGVQGDRKPGQRDRISRNSEHLTGQAYVKLGGDFSGPKRYVEHGSVGFFHLSLNKFCTVERTVELH